MVSGLYDNKGKEITPTFITPDTSRYDSIIGTLDTSARAGTAASGGQGVLNNRVGTSTFLGTISVKDFGGLEKVRLGKIDVNNWGLTVYDGVIIGGTITIGSGDESFNADDTGIWVGDSVFADAPFSVDMYGNLLAERGTIGGFTIESDKLYGGKIATARDVQAGETGVVMDASGLRGYDSVLGTVFNLPTDGSAPTFSSGVINNSIFEVNTNAVIRTSETVGDGTADSAGVLINDTGLYAAEANQTLANANVKILATGEATFSGSVKGGMTGYMTGDGYFMGLSGGAYKLSVGSPSGNYMSWDDEQLRIKGVIELDGPINLEGYATVELPVPPTNAGLTLAGAYE